MTFFVMFFVTFLKCIESRPRLLSRRSSFAAAEGESSATDDPHNGTPSLSDNWNGSNGANGGRKVDTAVLATSSMASIGGGGGGGGTPRYRGRGGSSRGGSSDHHRGAGGMGMGQNRKGLFGSQEEYGAIHLGRLQASAIRCVPGYSHLYVFINFNNYKILYHPILLIEDLFDAICTS